MWFTVPHVFYIIVPMSFLSSIRWKLVGILGKLLIWLWAKSSRMDVVGEEEYKKLRQKGRPVIFLVWHGRLFVVPYFFRKRGVSALISPSRDGEILSRIASGWGRVIRGSGSHVIKDAWNVMKKELQDGGELIIVPDGPRGPNRKMKLGALKLAQETGAFLVPFTFSSSRKKSLKSWDQFLIFRPFSKVVVIYGPPSSVKPGLDEEDLEKERQRMERFMIELDDKADSYF